jgi:hypothetical protein
MEWLLLHPKATYDMLGYLPDFLREGDPRSAKEQLNTNYPFGGFQPFKGFKMDTDGNLLYPGDPSVPAIAETYLRDEVVRMYQYAWVAIIQKDGSFEVARID